MRLVANFQGYLLKVGGVIFPHNFIQLNTFISYPNQRTEIDAYRDANNFLHRTTSVNYKTKIEFETLPLDLSEKEQVQAVLDNTINSTERKYLVTYWNDETNNYKVMTAYMPDVEYKIKEISSKSIKYNPIRIAFIEY